MKKLYYLGVVSLLSAWHIVPAQAQLPKASDSQCADFVPDNIVPFDISDEGKQFTVLWGMDTAWNNLQNMKKGKAHIGRNNIKLIRVSFTPDDELVDGELTASQKNLIDQRLRTLTNANIPKTVGLVLNDDHYTVNTCYTNDGRADARAWADLIAASVRYYKSKGYNIVGISPFNEPDYGWGQGSIDDMRAICELLQSDAYPDTKDIPIAAGNTLNCDQASYWYNYMKPYVQVGNTHQLAGSFANYANFFEEVVNDGNLAYGDELHGVTEAMVGVEHGMTWGVWWGFDSYARGAYCRSVNHGARLAYVEDRAHWGSACVMRNDADNKIQAILGTSERQANTATYQFISKDRDVYFDGHGPLRSYNITVPGGTAYQVGQTGAEKVIDVTYGEDVQPAPINGRYLIMNMSTQKVISVQGGNTSSGTPLVQNSNSGRNYQQWDIKPVDSRCGGDFSYYYISSALNAMQMDVLNFSMDAGGKLINFQGDKGSNEQWLLEYAGDGGYYIVNRESNMCLEVENNSSTENARIQQATKPTRPLARYMWRIIPVGASCELNAPSAPAGLQAVGQQASVLLTWDANSENDLAGYMILRRDADKDNWNTIARKVEGITFLDNTVAQGVEYVYKLKAIDKSDNQSEPCAEVSARATSAKGLIARWQFDDALTDASENQFDASIYGTASYGILRKKQGTKSLSLNDGNQYVLLPYQVANMREMTICTWVFLAESSSWQRIFDFGNGTDQYLFLTPSNGSEMRFAIKDGGAEQTLSADRLTTNRWYHVAVTFSDDKVSLYVNGELKAESADITLRPSDIQPVMNYIGRSQFVADPLFKGYIDDFRIYNYALGLDELQGVMEDLADGISTPVEHDGSQAVEGYYNLNGVRQTVPRRGVNIIRLLDGQTRKVMVK